MDWEYCTLGEFLELRPDWTLLDVAIATGYDYGTVRNIRSHRREMKTFQRALWLVLKITNHDHNLTPHRGTTQHTPATSGLH